MRGPAELLLWLFWQSLPARRRERLSELILSSHRRASRLIPISPVVVFPSHPSHEVLFEGFLRAGKGEEEAVLPGYSLAVTVYNEASSVERWIESVRALDHRPAQLVVVDGGSTDGTMGRLERHLSNHPLPEGVAVDLVTRRGASIAAGRNVAASHATERIVAFTDAGCELDKRWASLLMLPFALEPACDASFGWYRPVARRAMAAAAQSYVVPRLESVDPTIFLPSARSLAMTGDLFRLTGGFPEYLTDAGEDSLFGVALKSRARSVAFVPGAIVFWNMPQGLWGIFRMMRRYARGDAEGGRVAWGYYLALVRALFGVFGDAFISLVLFSLGSRFGWRVFDVAGTLAGLFALLRLWIIVRAYPPPENRDRSSGAAVLHHVAVLAMIVAQASGFLRGLAARPAVEKRRHTLHVTRHIVAIVAKAALRDEASDWRDVLDGWLAEGAGVTAVVVTLPKPGEVMVEHPRFETFQRSAFSLSVWCSRHGVQLRQAGIPLRIEDRVGDSLSRALSDQLRLWMNGEADNEQDPSAPRR